MQPEGAEAVVAWLADRDEVAWVEPRMPPRLRNRGAVPLVLGEALPGATTRAGGSAWEHGLRGEGEIIAIGDTGLDHDSCYFRDDARPVKTCFGGNLSCTGDYLHRKVSPPARHSAGHCALHMLPDFGLIIDRSSLVPGGCIQLCWATC